MEHLENKNEPKEKDDGEPDKEPDGPNWFFQPEFVPSVLFEDVHGGAGGKGKSSGCKPKKKKAAPAPAPAADDADGDAKKSDGDDAKKADAPPPSPPEKDEDDGECLPSKSTGDSEIGLVLMMIMMVCLIFSCCGFWYYICKHAKADCLAILKC